MPGSYLDRPSGVVPAFNGEICNWRQQARAWGIPLAEPETDAHLVLRAWAKFGPSCLNGFDGMLAYGTAPQVLWRAPRLILFAGDFTRYDPHAVRQQRHSVDVVRYRLYGEERIALETVASVAARAARSLHRQRRRRPGHWRPAARMSLAHTPMGYPCHTAVVGGGKCPCSCARARATVTPSSKARSWWFHTVPSVSGCWTRCFGSCPAL